MESKQFKARGPFARGRLVHDKRLAHKKKNSHQCQERDV